MGKIKDMIVREQDSADAAAQRVLESGGDDMAMTTSFLSQLDALLSASVTVHGGTEAEIKADARDDMHTAEADAQAEPEAQVEPEADTYAAIATATAAAAMELASELASHVPEREREQDDEPVSAAAMELASELASYVPAETVEEIDLADLDTAETPEQKVRRLELSKAIVGAVSTEKMVHGSMVLNGICTHCIRCGFKLTDAVSIERGMGPECSSKGYAEDPKDPDEMQALIELSEYPALVDFLTTHYKPQGVRGLMNGLVRVAALNRKTPVHSACANAIEALGYQKLAGALRDSLVMMKIKQSELHPNCLHVWVRKAEWTRAWSTDCYRHIPHCYFDKHEKGLIVPDRKECKAALWDLMIRHYPHECAGTPNGTVRIPTSAERAAKRAAKTG